MVADSRGWFELLARFKREQAFNREHGREDLCAGCHEPLCGMGKCKMPKYGGEA